MSVRSSFPSIAPSLTLDFAKSRRLDPRITFTRAQTSNIATYVGGDGLVKYAGPDEPRFDHKQTFRTNLIKYSETFTPSWTHQRIVLTNNSIVSPDGLTNGSKIQGNGDTGGAMSVYQQYTNVQPSSSWTISVFAKAGDAKWLAIEAYDGTSNDETFFNLESGTIGTIGNNMSNPIIKSYGNGWWRCSVVRTIASNANQVRPQFTLAVGNGTISVVDTKYFYLWGAQLEEGDTLTDYIATGPSAVTRTRTESLGLLVEESRTNLSLNSQDFTVTSSAGWQDSSGNGRATLIANTGIDDPSGGATASRWASGTTNSNELIYHLLPAELSQGVTYTASCWFRRVSGTGEVAFIVGDNAGGFVTSQLDSVPYGTWVRCHFTRTITGDPAVDYTGRAYISVYPSGYSSGTPTTIDIWGYQMEQGAFPTSYIPTSGAVVTRARDLARVLNITDFYNFNEGTYLVEGIVDVTLPVNTYGGIFGIGSGGGNSNFLYYNPTNKYGYYASNTGQSPASSLAKTYTPGTKYKLAGSYNSNGFSASDDGDISSNITTGVLNNTNNGLYIGSNAITGNTFGSQTIAKASYYPKRLTNSQLQTLTT